MRTSRRKFPIKSLLVLAYGLVLLLMAGLLVSERRNESLAFSLSHAAVLTNQGDEVLHFQGDKLRQGLKGVLTDTLVNEKARLWHLLADNLSKSVDVAGSVALVSIRGNKLISIGFDDEQPPQVLDSLEMHDSIIKVRIVGERALVGMQRNAGLNLIDLHDPKDLKLLAHYPQGGLVLGMAVDRGTVYYADLYHGIGRIDLSAESPVPEELVPLDSPWRMALLGTNLVVGTTKGEMVLFNISRDGQLIEVGRQHFSQIVKGVALTESALAVSLGDGLLQVYDLESWPKLLQVAEFNLPGHPLLLERIPGRQVVAASMLGGGVALVDLSRPANPHLSGELKLPETLFDMHFQRGRLFGASQDGLQVFALDKVANVEKAMLFQEAVISADKYDLYAWNGRVYGYNEQRLVDLGESAASNTGPTSQYLAIPEAGSISIFEQLEDGPPSRVAQLHVEEGAVNAELHGGDLYVVNRTGLQVYSLDRPSLPVSIGRLALPGLTGPFAISEAGYLLASTVPGGLAVVDIRHPARPVEVARLVFPQYLPKSINAQKILIDGPRAFISEGGGGVYVVDLDNPSRPELQQIIETKNYAINMAIHDGLLLVSDRTGGIFMIDVEDPGHARTIGSWPMPLRVDQVAVTTDGVIISNYPGGTMRLPLPQRLRDLQIFNGEAGQAEVQRVAKGQYAYLYDDEVAEKVKVDFVDAGND